jgi:hypothetical protein
VAPTASHAPAVAAGFFAGQRDRQPADLDPAQAWPGLVAPQAHEEQGPLARLRPDVELVGQAAQGAEAGARGAGGGHAVAQAGLHVIDPRTAVDREHVDPGHAFGLRHVQVEHAFAGMLEQVGAGLGDDQRQRAGAGFVEAEFERELLPGAARGSDVAGVHDRIRMLGAQ